MSDSQPATFQGKRVIVASVGVGAYVNRGNVLIERSTFRLLGLPNATPRFSIFEAITTELLRYINQHDYLVVTGCTTLQDDAAHHRCFDDQFEKITIPKICVGGTFYCEPEDTPSLRIARLYGTSIGTRDPWAYEYLRRNGIECELVGCPTLLDTPACHDWRRGDDGDVLVSSTPSVEHHLEAVEARRIRHVSHDAHAPGEDLLTEGLFDRAAIVITSRLHAALPAIARGTRVRFYSPRLSGINGCGSIRYSLLEYLGVPLDGRDAVRYPACQVAALKESLAAWLGRVIGKT